MVVVLIFNEKFTRNPSVDVFSRLLLRHGRRILHHDFPGGSVGSVGIVAVPLLAAINTHVDFSDNLLGGGC